MAKNVQPPTPAEQPVRRVRSPRWIFVVCALAAIAGAFILTIFVVFLIAVALVVIATVLQARGKRPDTYFAAATGVAAGALIFLVISFLTGS
jgi:4-hydroxybenzoate polyprenyltransferase